MKLLRRLVSGGMLLALVVGSVPVLASPPTEVATLTTPGTSRTLVLPEAVA